MPVKTIKERYQGRYIKWVIIALLVLGLLGTAVRFLVHLGPQVPGGDQVWSLSISAEAARAKKDDLIWLSPPINTPFLRVIAQKLQHTGMRIERKRDKASQSRDILFRVITPGTIYLNAEFTVHQRSTARVTLPSLALEAEIRDQHLKSTPELDIESHEVVGVLKKLADRVKNQEQLVDSIHDYVHKNIIRRPKTGNESADKALRSKRAGALGKARAMVALCRAAAIPARIVTGFILEETLDLQPHYWVEIHDDINWVPFDPEKGHARTLPRSYLPMNRNDDAIISSEKITALATSYELEQVYDYTGLNLTRDKRVTDILDLERFPPATRATFATLLMMPLGALLTAFCRSLLGIRCYGTFTPTLLALAAVYADKVTVFVLFAIVITIALSGRSIMPDKLSRVPRLSVVFTIVAMSMVFGISLMDYFNYNPDAAVVLLPIVIVTTLIDRFYSALDEHGITIAMRRLGWTAVIGMLCYLVLRLEGVGYWILSYPEVHFITLAAILSLTLYKYRPLSKLKHFTWIAEPKRAKDIAQKDAVEPPL
jgi:transglutaminase-like putative cysteine protease